MYWGKKDVIISETLSGETGKAKNSSVLGDGFYYQTGQAMEKRLKKRQRQSELPPKKRKELCKCGEVERREEIVNRKMDKKLA